MSTADDVSCSVGSTGWMRKFEASLLVWKIKAMFSTEGVWISIGTAQETPLLCPVNQTNNLDSL